MADQMHPILKARLEQGISQARLAGALGIHPNKIATLEKGQNKRVYVHELYAIAKVLGIKQWWTLATEDNLLADPIHKPPHTVQQAAKLLEARKRRLAERKAQSK